MEYVDNRGVRIGYQTYGQGEPLVLIHGWSSEGRYWNEFGYVSKLSDKFQVVVPDLRGHGESDTPKDRDFSDAAFASDVIAVLDDVGIESAHNNWWKPTQR
jgi:pimeloyl-ACP methyl ester carboxylesterase